MISKLTVILSRPKPSRTLSENPSLLEFKLIIYVIHFEEKLGQNDFSTELGNLSIPICFRN